MSQAPPAASRERPLKASRGRPWRRLATVLLVLGALGVSGWLARKGLPTPARADQASIGASAPAPTRVEVGRPVARGIRRTTMQPGTVLPYEGVDLYAKVDGYLKTQAVDIGDAVTGGQVLAEIDAPELVELVAEAEAAVAQAAARAVLARARVATAAAERDAAAAATDQAEAEIDRLAARRGLEERQYERTRLLRSRGAVDDNLLDEQRHELEAATAAERFGRAAILTARAQHVAAGAKVDQAEAEVDDAEATHRAAESKLARGRVMAGYTRILAPFDGLVTVRNYHPSAFIQSAASRDPLPLLRVVRTDVVRVIVQVPDRDVALLDVGDPATIEVDGLKGRSFAGTVARVAAEEDPASRTMRAEIDLPNPSGEIRAGMYGRATIELRPPSGQLTLPASAVVHAKGGASVFVVRDGRARKVPVTPGDDDGRSVEILDGLTPDALVVLRPGGNLRDGEAVDAREAAAP